MSSILKNENVLVTGGAGYVGSNLVPKLLAKGHKVSVLDLYLYGEGVFGDYGGHPNLSEIRGDLRSPEDVKAALKGCNAVIHLACISNDPSFELDPVLGKSINLDCFRPLVRASKEAGIKRFIYASSSSVYGIKEEPEVTEELALEPLTDYSRFKVTCEEILEEERKPGFTTVTIRPATVCGYAPRLRLDLTVNILSAHAYHNGKIKVFGGTQKRPNIHIEDMTDLYAACLQHEDFEIDGKIFNAGYENHSVAQIAEIVRDAVGDRVEIIATPSDDLRSYHVCSDKIRRELGFEPVHTIEDAVKGLVSAFDAGYVPNAMTSDSYYNIKTMQSLDLS